MYVYIYHITYRFITYGHLSSQLVGFLQLNWLNWKSTEDVVRVCWQRSQALSACRDRVIRFWKLETGELLGFEKHQPGSPWNVFFNWKAWNLGVSGCVGEQESLPVRGFHWSTTFMPSCFRHRHTHTCCMCSVRPFVLQLLVPVWSCRYLRGYLHSFVLMDAAARLGSFFLVCLNSTSPRCSLLRGHTSSVCCLLVNWDLRREAWLDRMDK